MKKLLVAALAILGFYAKPAQAVFPIYQSVLISTSPTYAHSLQPGAIDIGSMTVAGPITSTGAVTFSGTSALTGAVTLGGSGNSVTISSNAVFSGAVILGGSAGTSGQVAQSNGPGAAQSYTTALTGGTTTNWTANQTFSSATVTTLFNQLMRYRRPVLQYNSGTQANLETGNNGTSGSTTVIFPDGTVYSETSSTLLNVVVTSTANWGNGSATAGIRPTEKQINNTWYAAYVVKSTATGNTTDFALVLSTYLPVQANFATLNGASPFFGTNSWVYVGLLRYGDQVTGNAIPKFFMAGNKTVFNNSVTGNVQAAHGIRLATTASGGAASYSYSSGTSGTALPSNIIIVDFLCQAGANSAASLTQRFEGLNAADSFWFFSVESTNIQLAIPLPSIDPTLGLDILTTGSPNLSYDSFLTGFVDGVLGVGSNPQL